MAKIVQCTAFNQSKLSFIISTLFFFFFYWDNFNTFENQTMLKKIPLDQFGQSLIKTQSSLNSCQAQQ